MYTRYDGMSIVTFSPIGGVCQMWRSRVNFEEIMTARPSWRSAYTQLGVRQGEIIFLAAS
jgi:hypothetical protein